MESKLSLQEFRLRLKNNIVIGSPKLKLSPLAAFTFFDGISKPFYGLFDDKGFRLTMNSSTSPTYLILKGKYKIANEKVQISYVIEPHPKFHLTWVKYFPVIILVLLNLLLFFAKGVTIEPFIVMNLSIVFLVFYSRWNSKRKRKNIEKKFIEIFDIIE